jgi:alpha-1,3-rhamnosyl/mannosyltransferase
VHTQQKVLVDLLSYTGSKGGTDVYIRNLYTNLGQITHNFNFVGLSSREARGLDMSWFPGPIKYSRLSGKNKISWAIGEIVSVNRFANKIKPNFIHCPANFGPLTSKFPMILTLHDALYWSKPHLAPNRFLLFGVRFMQKFTSRASKEIITDSVSSVQEIVEHMGISRSKVTPVYLGSDFNSNHVKSAVSVSNYFLAGGNRFRHKNWENLLRAWSLINPEQRPKLIVTGGGKRDPLVKLVESHSLTSHVQLLAWVSESELENLYLNASAVVIPSLFEGFSLSVMQAMAVRKPLLASDIPVHRELAENVALFFDPNSPESIAQAILGYNKDSKILNTRLNLGFEKSKDFSWALCATETLAVFSRI